MAREAGRTMPGREAIPSKTIATARSARKIGLSARAAFSTLVPRTAPLTFGRSPGPLTERCPLLDAACPCGDPVERLDAAGAPVAAEARRSADEQRFALRAWASWARVGARLSTTTMVTRLTRRPAGVRAVIL